ncbi:hypothetical protein [Methanobrevibacter arboriphilus]|uniref:hypothetical protein n=1 Tax=Methanobrevibacter arboriphilus TaxID=39441 RepID=UPI000AD873EA|nr:hypothetical protein [Methanobrevibacter arboriphilus]
MNYYLYFFVLLLLFGSGVGFGGKGGTGGVGGTGGTGGIGGTGGSGGSVMFPSNV